MKRKLAALSWMFWEEDMVCRSSTNSLVAVAMAKCISTTMYCGLKIRKIYTSLDPRDEAWVNLYLRYEFKLHFRMDETTFDKLVAELKNVPSFKGNQIVPYHKRLQICLWYLAKGDTLIILSEKFNVSMTTCHEAIEQLLNDVACLQGKHIKWPTQREATLIAAEFYNNASYPNVIGAIDGCNITAKVPASQQDSYLDRKFRHSIKLQGICTYEKIFTDISTGWPGSLHDSRVLQLSQLKRNIERFGENKYFYGRYHLVGDSAYALSTWLMNAYRVNAPNEAQKRHDYHLSRARVVIENAFGLLKGRWRILFGINTYSISKATQIITCAFILHNFCLKNSDEIECNEELVPESFDQSKEVHHHPSHEGLEKRNIICSAFA